MSRTIVDSAVRALAVLALLVTAVPELAFAQASSRGAAPAKISDDDIEERIEYRLETNPLTKKYDIDVESTNAVVTLTGDVATEGQKEEAGRLAKITGVDRVDNNIKVDKNADRTLAERAQAGLSKTGEVINDTWITTKVKWLLLKDDDTRGSDIAVDTKEQVVTLKGRVKSEAAHVRAVELAKRTDGVKRVVDQLESPANR
jgi:osmotically-inducible protein OsmY